MYLARIFNGDQPDRRTALEIASFRLINAQQQIATMSDLAEIKLPAKPSADDATVLFNGVRTGIARVNYMHGILQDANAALKDCLDEIADGDVKTSALEDRYSKLQLEVAARDAKTAALEESYLRLKADIACRIGQFEETMSKLQSEFNAGIAQRDDDLARLQAGNADLNAEIVRLQNSLADKVDELQLIYQSRSWRMTQPLRALRRFVARLMPRQVP